MFAALSWSFTFAPLVGAFAVIVSAAVVAGAATRQLGVQRQLQSTQSFLELLAVAHGRPHDGRVGVSISEQVAAVHLVAELGSEHLWLEPAAVGALRSMWSNDGTDPVLRAALAAGLDTLEVDADKRDAGHMTV